MDTTIRPFEGASSVPGCPYLCRAAPLRYPRGLAWPYLARESSSILLLSQPSPAQPAPVVLRLAYRRHQSRASPTDSLLFCVPYPTPIAGLASLRRHCPGRQVALFQYRGCPVVRPRALTSRIPALAARPSMQALCDPLSLVTNPT